MKLNVIIVTPMLREFHCAREVFGAKETEGQPFRMASAAFGHSLVRLVCCGRNLDDLIRYFCTDTPDLLIDSGTAGALSGGMAPGSVIRGEVFRYGDRTEITIPPQDWMSAESVGTGIVMTVDQAVLSVSDREPLKKQADICTMESYHLAAAAIYWGCRFASIRVISDSADENSVADFKKNSRPFCMNLYGILKQMLMNISH